MRKEECRWRLDKKNIQQQRKKNSDKELAVLSFGTV